MVQNRKTEDEVKYGQLIIKTWTLLESSYSWELYSVINPTNDGTENIKARILAANKIYYSLQNIFRSQGIHRNSEIRLLARPVLWHGGITLN